MRHSETRLALPTKRPRESEANTTVIVNGEISAFFEVNVPDHAPWRAADEFDDATAEAVFPF